MSIPGQMDVVATDRSACSVERVKSAGCVGVCVGGAEQRQGREQFKGAWETRRGRGAEWNCAMCIGTRGRKSSDGGAVVVGGVGRGGVRPEQWRRCRGGTLRRRCSGCEAEMLSTMLT